MRTHHLQLPLALGSEHPMSLAAADSATALRNRSPILSRIAGDRIGNPR
jgi:hypothetical protein